MLIFLSLGRPPCHKGHHFHWTNTILILLNQKIQQISKLCKCYYDTLLPTGAVQLIFGPTFDFKFSSSFSGCVHEDCDLPFFLKIMALLEVRNARIQFRNRQGQKRLTKVV